MRNSNAVYFATTWRNKCHVPTRLFSVRSNMRSGFPQISAYYLHPNTHVPYFYITIYGSWTYSVSAPQCFLWPPVTNFILLYSTLLCKKKARAPGGHKKFVLTKLGGGGGEQNRSRIFSVCSQPQLSGCILFAPQTHVLSFYIMIYHVLTRAL